MLVEQLETGQPGAVLHVGYQQRAAFYHLEWGGTDDHAFLSMLAGQSNVRSVLEIPAGAGRNLPIWQTHWNTEVTVADVEPEMVRLLRSRIAAAGMAHVNAVQADMKALDLPGRFDLIVAPQEAFQLVATRTDAAAILGGLKRHLSSNGQLMVDLARLDPAAVGPFPHYYDPNLADGVEMHEWTESLGSHRTLSRARIQYHGNAQVRFRLNYTLTDDGVAPQEWSSEMTLRNFSVEEFSALANAAGLQALGIYCDYSLRPYDGRSSRSIFLLRAGR